MTPRYLLLLPVAIRILRSAQELGWATVALSTDSDTTHASFADEVVALDRPSRYLDASHLVDIERR